MTELGLILLIAGQFSLIWYKLGKIEQKVKMLANHLSDVQRKLEKADERSRSISRSYSRYSGAGADSKG